MQPYRIIDTHTHLYGEAFEKDLADVLARATESGILYMLLPNIDKSTFAEFKASVQQFPEILLPMIGLHPTSVNDSYREELSFVRDELRSPSFPKYYGVGEVGLDYYWDKTFKRYQQEAFATQIEWAKEYNLPLSIHTRSAVEDAIDIYKEAGEGKCTGSFHSFTGTAGELKRIEQETNAFIGINGVVTFKNSDLRDFLARTMPIERVVIETDAPYLAPVPFRGKRNEPSYLNRIISELSLIYRKPEAEVSEQLLVNSLKLFNLGT
ncbi:MAG: TatD family hydrolase [Porphyromonas sp.]|nr:TatD family hydrolase [Porphyromonas sp.]